MRDSSHHDATTAGSRSPDQLIGRLLRRADGSVGVIDVGWTQRRFAYTTDWVAERFAVLGLLNARYGTVDTRAAGTSAALPIVHGSFARKEFDTPPDESPARTPPDEASPRTTADRAPTSGREARAAEISAPSPNVGNTRIIPLVRRKIATPSPDVALPRAESQRAPKQKSQTPPAQKSQPSPLARESAPRAAAERPSPLGSPNPTAAEVVARQPSASHVAPRSATTKQGAEARATVAPSQATHEPTPRFDAKAEAPQTEATTDSAAVGGSGEANRQSPIPEQQRPQPSQAVSPLALRKTAPIVSRVARAAVDSISEGASDSLAHRGETYERGARGSESPRASEADPRAVQNRTNSALPLAFEQTATEHHPHHDRQTLHAEVTSSATQAEVTPATAEAKVTPPVVQADTARARLPVSAPEVLQRPLHLSGARMIWRKGVTLPDGAPHAGQPGAARSHSVHNSSSQATLYREEAATSYESRTAAADAESFAPAAPAQSDAGGIDLEQITEHVSRVILRRVSVERERRGIGRWL